MEMNWYVIHTYASYEHKVREAILNGVKGTSFAENLGQILIPTEKSFHIRNGKKIEVEKKIFTSYIIIEANLVPELYSFILRINGVTNFLGSGKNPQALSKKEIDRMLGKEEKVEKKILEVDFQKGDIVDVVSGPFTDFNGVIEDIDREAEKVSLNVNVFGRNTSVELNMVQIKKKK